jgi:gliding motility associated protien GldN
MDKQEMLRPFRIYVNKIIMIKFRFFIVFVALLFIAEYAEAQRSRRGTTTRRRSSGNTRTSTRNRTNTRRVTTTAVVPPPVAVEPPKPVDSMPFLSKRNDNAYQESDAKMSKDRTPLPYENFRKDDQAYAHRLWEEIDLREKMNQSFVYKGIDDNGPGSFVNILIKIINDSRDPRKSKEPIIAFSDDRFTTPIDEQGMATAMGGKKGGTRQVPDPKDPSGRTMMTVTDPDIAFNPDEVKTIRIKGDWVFDKESSVLKYRLLGIAPVRTYDPFGTGIDQTIPMFWLYYPDLRAALAKYDVYNPKNMGQPMTWEELFETRYFATYVTKSNHDNPNDWRLKDMYENSTITQLYEGQRIKDKIFDYEQNLWSY